MAGFSKPKIKEPDFCTTYRSKALGFIQSFYRSKQHNDDFAAGMEIMGHVDVTKLARHPFSGSWLAYKDALPWSSELVVEVGEQLQKQYPFGYRSEDKEP